MNETDSPSPASPPSPGTLQGERHVSEVAGRSPVLSQRAGIGAIVAGGAILCGIVLLTAQKPHLTPEPGPVVTSRPVVRYEAPPPLPPPPATAPVAPPSLPAPPPLPMATAPGTPSPPPRPPRLLVYNAAVSGNAPSASSAPGSSYPNPATMSTGMAPQGWNSLAGASEPVPREDLQARLSPTRLTGVSASVLRHQPYLLTMGTLISCVLQTAMDSTLPGFVTCTIPQDIQGKTGLTLLDRGTRVVGEFKGGLRQGVERLFVVWTRAETPQGVVITLDSPATDPLGRSGLDGEVDRHFWQRFGGALLLSTVDGVIQAAVASSAQQGTTTINTGQAQGIIAETLRGSVNLPPTVRKNQGELVSIFVARDLDFSTVYSVQPMPVSGLSGQESSRP